MSSRHFQIEREEADDVARGSYKVFVPGVEHGRPAGICSVQEMPEALENLSLSSAHQVDEGGQLKSARVSDVYHRVPREIASIAYVIYLGGMVPRDAVDQCLDGHKCILELTQQQIGDSEVFHARTQANVVVTVEGTPKDI